MICCKKYGKKYFSKIFFQRMSDRPKKFFSIFQNFIFFFENWPQWDPTNVERNRVKKYKLNWSVQRGVTQNIPPVRGRWTPNEKKLQTS